jgi:hypothetical protein
MLLYDLRSIDTTTLIHNAGSLTFPVQVLPCWRRIVWNLRGLQTHVIRSGLNPSDFMRERYEGQILLF